ncbi:MAG: hypothetical protein Q9165_006658 [Trypethelium subeluteriae]
MVSAAARGLYDGSRQERSSKPLRRYNHLSESEVSLLTRVFSNAPPQSTPRISPRHEAYANITQELIQALPSVLTTPPPTKHFFGLFTTDNNQCMVKDPRKLDGSPFRGLCDLHSRLQCPLTHSILRFVLDEITCYMPRLFDLPFEPEYRLLFELLVDVTSLYLRPVDFEKLWGRPSSQEWERQKNRCAACILARIGSDASVLVSLGAIYRARIREETYDFHLRVFWYDEWIRACAGQDGEDLVEKSHAIGSAMKRVVRRARKEKEALDEIDPNASWARKRPTTRQSPESQGPVWIERSQSMASRREKIACGHHSISSSFSDEETLARMGGGPILPQTFIGKPSTRPAFAAEESSHYFSSCSGATAMEDDDCMEMDIDGVSEEAHTSRVKVHQPAYQIPSPARYANRVDCSIAEGSRRPSALSQNALSQDPADMDISETIFEGQRSIGSKQSTLSTDSAAGDLTDWVDMCAYMNKTPSLTEDGSEPSEFGMSRMSGTSDGVDCAHGTPLNKPTSSANLDNVDDFSETPKAIPHIHFSPVPSLEEELPLILNTAEQSPMQALRPKPSAETVVSGSVYSVYEGPYGKRYKTPLPSPPKPLHIRKASDGLPAASRVARTDSAILSPPLTKPAFQIRAKAVDIAPDVQPSTRHDRSPAFLSSAQPNAPSPSLLSPVVQNSEFRPSTARSAASAMRAGMSLGGPDFRRFLSCQEEEDEYVESPRSLWLHEFEWEQRHPATSQVIC